MSSSTGSQQPLLTSKAVALSLSAPRAPPIGSIHREWLIRPVVATKQQQEHHNKHHLFPSNSTTTSSSSHQDTAAAAMQQHPTKRTILQDQARARIQHKLFQTHFFVDDDDHNHNNAIGPYNNHQKNKQHFLPHPHLPATVSIHDQVTRWLGTTLPVTWHNAARDSGLFRWVVDRLTPLAGGPVLLSRAPRSVGRQWMYLSRVVQRIYYGDQEVNHHHSQQQYYEYYSIYGKNSTTTANNVGQTSTTQSRGAATTTTEMTASAIEHIVFFVHGGAWGTGMPYMYRLLVSSFLNATTAVVSTAYRTYPTAATVQDQVDDCQTALEHVLKQHPTVKHLTVMGHSSGAHVALLMLVERAKQRYLLARQRQQQEVSDSSSRQSSSSTTASPTGELPITRFIGLSGPYDISHHFDYEAARGVEELSPMKAICGYTRAAFRYHSPVYRLQDALNETSMDDNNNGTVADYMPSNILLVHGMDDDTVPFTSTAEAGRLLRTAGVTNCEELYLADQIGHQETVVHFMVGGITQSTVLEWLRTKIEASSPSAVCYSVASGPARGHDTVTLVAKSKL